jgi:hypothetical protein
MIQQAYMVAHQNATRQVAIDAFRRLTYISAN